MTTIRDIVTDALHELRYLPSDQQPSAGDAAAALRYYNRMVASWRNQGVTIGYPTVTTWKREWKLQALYAAGDGILNGGNAYVCSTEHTATLDNEPGRSIDGALYWDATAATVATLDSTFPLETQFEDAAITLLAVMLAPSYSISIEEDTKRRARDGWIAITARYMRTPEAQFDPALVRVPSRRWPYSVPVTDISESSSANPDTLWR
jgi:hypothetical protein